MVTIPELEGSFLPLLRCIQDKTARDADRVDAYLRFTERLREEQDDFIMEVCSYIKELSIVFKNDIINLQAEVCQASLQSLGHCLYQQQIARAFCVSESKDLLQGLTKVIATTEEKGICTRALWCIAKQNLPEDIVSDKLSDILSSIECALNKNLQSVTVDNEVICVIDRLLQQLPDSVMIKNTHHWSKLVFPLAVSSAGKVREYSLAIFASHLSKIISSREEVLPWLMPILKSGFIGELSKLCSEKKELFVLKVWSCIVPVLGKALHRSSLINDILKLVEQGFKNPSVSIQVESYFAWQVLIDNFATNQDVLSAPKRVNLIMMPLLNSAVKERNEKVEAARLATWWHFVCAFDSKRLVDLFDKICIPLLQFIFGTSIDQASLLKSRGFGDFNCPPTPTNGKFVSDTLVQTPKATARRSLKDVGTPKTPTIVNASFAKETKDKLLIQGCEILKKLLSLDGSSQCNMKFTLEQDLQGPVFQSKESFEKHSSVLINSVREAFRACGSGLQDSLLMSIWENLVEHIENVFLKESLDRNRIFKSHFLPMLAALEELIEGSCVSRITSLKMLETVTRLSSRLLSHHLSSLESQGNPHGTAAVVVLHLLLSPALFKDGQNNERLFLAFENLLCCGIDTPLGQLIHIQAVLQLLQSLASVSEKKQALRHLWSSTVLKLNEHINKNNEVNQGNTLEHNFAAVYLAFLLPAKELLNTSLGQGEIKLINKDLDDLYRSFSRAAALLPSVDTNICAEELCLQLLDTWSTNKEQDIYYLTGIGNLVTTILECMDYTNTPILVGKSPIKSPSNWTKKHARPLGNMTSTVELARRLVAVSSNMMDSIVITRKTSNPSILAGFLSNLIDSLSMFFQHLNGSSVIAAATESLSVALAPIVQSAHTSVKEPKSGAKKTIFTAKFIQKVEKLWQDILTSVQSRHEGPYNSELLAIMSPLLEVTFVHHRRTFKNKSLIFWNATFANSQPLNYPDTLRSILMSVKGKANLTLPGLKCTQDAVKGIQPDIENEEMSQITEPKGSPIRRKSLMFFGGSPKVRGSFLHKAAEAEKAMEKNSPKKAWTEPRLTSKGKVATRNTHARRKLPLSLLDDDSQDFVRIAPSPTKKRLLTEHQKEVMREKSALPILYNCLDQSQDSFYGTPEAPLCTPSPIEEQTAPFEDEMSADTETKFEEEQKNECSNVEKDSADTDGDRQATKKDRVFIFREKPEAMDTDTGELSPTTTSDSVRETPIKSQPVTTSQSTSHMEDSTSPEIIPSSQVSSGSSLLQFKSLRSGRIPVNSMVVLLKDVNEKDKSKSEIVEERPKVMPTSITKTEPEERPEVKPTSTGNTEPEEERPEFKPTSTGNTEPEEERPEFKPTSTGNTEPEEERPEVKPTRTGDIEPVEELTEVKQTSTSKTEPFKQSTEIKPTSVKIEEEESIDKKSSASEENHFKEDDDGQAEVKTTKEMTSKKKKKRTAKKSFETTSPVAGRTRRGRQIKLETPQKDSEILDNDIAKTPESSEGTRAEDSSEQHNFDSSDDHLDSDKQVFEQEVRKKTESDQEKADVKSKEINQYLFSKDVMSSPVSCTKIKFMKPNTGSPTQLSSIKNYQSPVSSPTTGILKRYTGRYDSPSPPNKVRRVSFAMPLAQEAQQKELSVNSSVAKPKVIESDQTDSSSKEPEPAASTPSRGADHFTIIKRRRRIPSEEKEGKACIYPDLVGCNAPVEQVLPSLCSFAWSRGLGHVVHAKNIRTVGNLSSLTEYQTRNLPIRSPKVQTLRAALSSFHQKTKGLKSKSTRDITAVVVKEKKFSRNDKSFDTNPPTILEANDTVLNKRGYKQEKLLPTISDEMVVNSNELYEKSETNSENSASVETFSESEENNEMENIVLAEEEEKNEESVEEGPQEPTSRESNVLEDKMVCMPSKEQEPLKLSENVSETPENEELTVEEPYTPPLPIPDEGTADCNTLDEQDNSRSPTITAVSVNPPVLFTPTDDESEDDLKYCSIEFISKIDEDLEKNSFVSNAKEDNVGKKTENDGNYGETEEELGEQMPQDNDNVNVETKDRTMENKNEEQVGEKCCEDKSPETVNKTEEKSPKQTFYHSLNAILETATPEVLARLSNQEIFLAHKNLTELMSRVVTALQEKLQAPSQGNEQ